MSIKSTIRIKRQAAQTILHAEIEDLPNSVLGTLLNVIADSEQSKRLSAFDRFIVSDFEDENQP